MVAEKILNDGISDYEIQSEFPGVWARARQWVFDLRKSVEHRRTLENMPAFEAQHSWQSDLAEVLRGDPHRRRVHWYWETRGNVGKTYFAQVFDPANTFIVSGGKHSDIYYAYLQSKAKIFIIDSPRELEERFPYSVLESMKNGMIFSSKYESTMYRLSSPIHVVVFANFEPDRSKLSSDRWDIHHIVTL